jgi:uncharacterized membrane-anchored protein
MTRFWVTVVILLVSLLPATRVLGQEGSQSAPPESAQQQEQEREAKLEALHWVKGPTKVTINGNSTLQLPEGYRFLEPGETAKFEELTHNIPGENEVLVTPAEGHWVAFLDFDAAGLVKDNEKIDADQILATLRSNQESANEERRRRGWDALQIEGWAVPPAYNSTTKRLEWATLLSVNGHRTINFSTKILGRKGYTSVILACGENRQAAAVAELNSLLTGYSFDTGERYADWVPGDKVAEIGLGALILGGTAVAAAKSGLLKGLGLMLVAAWKFVLVGLAAAGAFLRSLFVRKKPQGPIS